ncbi:uncharacterized protein LOC119322481 [Triticum dicoccoides]|uniref:Uncharacterized protein n=1 Tax=Triticum turgidum subsp. durum TaxID=4567 RepID=A0A9R0YQK0_TRITD|nr:uncharacterized protein LOC119322481 [Triticum dicoccoides]VAI59152.1 unnamed protein product [Triticum turgidum subsp. durum]
MSCRRFVNMVVDTVIGDRHAYALHCINMSGLFYPTKPTTTQLGGADAKDGNTVESSELPRPAMSFYPCRNNGAPVGSVEFMPVSRDKNDILTIDQDGRTLMYSVASRAFHILPPLQTPIWEPTSVIAGGKLYVMKSSPFPTTSHCFEALIYGHHPGIDYLPECWYWRSLPPPPFRNSNHRLDDNQFIGGGYADEDGDLSRVTAYTVVNDLDIWVSQGGTTYSFDTVSSAWTSLGEWTLPFRGHAEYIPENKLWFGLSSDGDLLCTSDLSSTSRPPQLHNLWKELAPPKEWFLHNSYLVHLGSGKFCIAKFFETGRISNTQYNERFAVLTGVEVKRCGKHGTELRMVKHGSRRYSLNKQSYFRVF